MVSVWLTLLAVATWPGTARAASPPARIVSINLCAEQILVDLVPRHRIAAVSHLAADATVSAVAEKAAGLPVTRGEAESVLAFDPDLVLAGAFSTPATVSILERVGRRVVRVPQASDLAGVKAVVRMVADAVGESARGERLIADLERRLEEARPPSSAGAAPTALVYQVNALSAGRGTLADAVLGWAGFRNHAAHIELGAGNQVPLEMIVAKPPDLLVLTGPAGEYRTVVAENLRHPALAHAMQGRRSVVIPWRYWLCGTPHVAEAVALLVRERERLAAPRIGHP
ncbi:MAG: ABC transporter substrate-binding protein [Hyphomicrobiaceae bacterium]|nr:ABC transporter substrate-binding protein [Hyphomicrobiaceae bacterium]